MANHCAVVFGGAAGIGRAVAHRLSERSVSVVVADLNEADDSTANVAAPIRFERCDAADPDIVRSVLERSARQATQLSVVTTVGGAHPIDLLKVDVAAWDADIRFNLTTAYVVCSTALSVMTDQKIKGSIVTMSSSYGFKPAPLKVAYSAAKAGIAALTRSAAIVGAEHDIRVNCVAPGVTETDRIMRQMGNDEALAALRASVPLGRIATPDDVAAAVTYLLLDAPTVTGQVLHVNSGTYLP